MIQQTFPITGRNPRVVLEQLEGNLTVQPWDRQEISVETDGPVAVLQQENDTVIIKDCRTDLLLRVPAIRRIISPLVTDIEARQISRNATIEGAGNVLLEDVGGNVSLHDIYGNVELANVREVAELFEIGGNLRASTMPHLRSQHGIGGNASLRDITHIELDAVGGNLSLKKAETALINVVGGNLDADNIAAQLRCNAVGGNASIANSHEAEITLSKVGGNLQIDGSKSIQSSLVGGNLRVASAFPPGSHNHFHVGGNARIFLPENANLTIHGIVGGNASSDSATFIHGGGFVNLTYGEGAASLNLHVGGNLKLLGGGNPRSSNMGASWAGFASDWAGFGHEWHEWADFGRGWANFGREMGRFGRQMGRTIASAFHEPYQPGKYDRY
jgi:hypothetical protein